MPLPGIQVSLLYAPNLPDHSVPNHPVFPRCRFCIRYFVCQRIGFPTSVPCIVLVSDSGPRRSVQASPLGRRLAENTRPKRVRYPTDWSFTSCCSPPRLAATQLQSATGCSVDLERTFTSLIKCARRRTTPAFAGVTRLH
jgi:hypothetical protein